MRVFSNTAVSLDGRIASVGGDHVRLGSPRDLQMMDGLRAAADAVVVGGATFRDWPIPLVDSGRSRPMVNAVLTRSGVADCIDPNKWAGDDVSLRVYGPATVRPPALAKSSCHLADGIDDVLDDLRALGCEEVLLESGGALIYEVLRRGLLDEMYVTICPWLIGGVGAPSLVDGQGFGSDEMPALELIDSRRDGDELFVHYKVL